MDLQRRGPGLLLRDIERGEDPDIAAVIGTVTEVSPDILLLTGFDWDRDLAAARALEARLAAAGAGYPNLYGPRPNTGMATGLDMDGDGRLGGPRDAQGFGWFTGQGGMVLLSRLPVDEAEARDFSAQLWSDFPDALLPMVDGRPFPSEEALAAQRLSTTGHWDVPVILPDGTVLHLLCFAAGPPVFDGPEDRNGRRNHDEVAFWRAYLDGMLDRAPPDGPVVVLGDANLDPADGEGRRAAITGLLRHPRLQDPAPESAGGALAARRDGGVNAGQVGPAAQDTADWSDVDGPGNLRVDYVLPDARLTVLGAGVFWPRPDDPLHALIEGEDAPRHRLIWVDLDIPG